MVNPIRILIVEDETIIAMGLQECLSDAGYSVVATLASGEEALHFCQDESPDLVLMDVRLEGKLDGIAAAQLLKEKHDIPSVLLTAHYDTRSVVASQQAGVLGYLIKPYDDRELIATLTTALSQARKERELRAEIDQLRGNALNRIEESADVLMISTLKTPLVMSYKGRTVYGDLFTRTQRELLALVLSTPHLRLDREVLELELWPESPARLARTSFDATLMRLRKLFNSEIGYSVAGNFFTLKNSVLAIENSSVDLHRFHALDEEGSSLRRRGSDSDAISPWLKAVALWHGEFLSGMSSHHSVLPIRQHVNQRIVDICYWLAEIFALRQRPEEQKEALSLALRAQPSNERTVSSLYTLLICLNRKEEGSNLLKEFSRTVTRDGMDAQELKIILRRIEQRAALARCQQKSEQS